MFTVSLRANQRPAPLHGGGDYDRIVCEPCEQSFKAADDCFHDLYRRRDEGTEFVTGNGARSVVYDGFNQALLQRFFLTCLMRAHLSNRAPYRNVDLGPYAGQIGALLRLPPSTVDERFPVTILRESHQLGRAIYTPHVQPLGGVKFWRLGLPGFVGMVRVGKVLREYVPMLGLALGLRRGIVMLDTKEVPPLVKATLQRAVALHQDDIDRMVAKVLRAS